MIYEIRKRSKIDKDIWSIIATSDTWRWANEIAESLNSTNAGEFAVFKHEEMIADRMEAMKL